MALASSVDERPVESAVASVVMVGADSVVATVVASVASE